MPQKDGSTRNYKMTTEGDQTVYIAENGYRYAMVTNEAGEYYMKSLHTQTKPVGIQPLPQASAAQINAVSARHAHDITNQRTVDGAAGGDGTGGLSIAGLLG
jgi:hypothetical protein